MTPRRWARLNAILDRRQPDLTVLMDNVHKPHNLAAIVRSCDAVGVGTIHAVAEDDEVRIRQQSAAGSGRYVELTTHRDHAAAFAALRATGHRVLAADAGAGAVDFRGVDFTRPTAVLLGAELRGVDGDARADADAVVAIPLLGAVASLNVSVAAAVLLYEAQRQRQAAGLYDTPRVDDATRQRLLFAWGYRRLAQRCRDAGRPYPRLGPDGQLVEPLPRL